MKIDHGSITFEKSRLGYFIFHLMLGGEKELLVSKSLAPQDREYDSIQIAGALRALANELDPPPSSEAIQAAYESLVQSQDQFQSQRRSR